MAALSIPALQKKNAALEVSLKETRAENRSIKQRAAGVIADANKRVRNIARSVPTWALYAGGGAVGAGALAYFAYDYAVGWFGADSYLPALVLVAGSVGLFFLTPSLVRVTASRLDSTVPVASGCYGACVGIAGVALYRAYTEVYAKPAKP